MPWCPKCRTEYREEFQRCSDCDSELVDELAVTDEPQTEDEDEKAFLTTAADSFQADILESKLKFYGIPVMKSYRETGDYLKIYMGATPFGVDLYVPSKLLTVAKELMENGMDEIEAVDKINSEQAESGEDPFSAADENNFKRRGAKTLIIVMLLIPFLIWMVYELVQTVIRLVSG